MINKTENKSAFAQSKVQLKFPKINAALRVSDVLIKPLIKNRAAFLETHKTKKSILNKWLRSLNANDLSRLQPHLEPVALKVGQSLYQPHARVRSVYFPESAVISNLQMLEDGRTIEIAMTGNEGAVGLSSIFNSEPSDNWTEVSVAGTALKLNAQFIKQEFVCNGSLQSPLLNYLNSYIEQISRRAICNNYHLIEARFCGWLLALRNCHDSNKFFLTHEQIARYLGVHRPGISHIAKELRGNKVIDYKRGQIIILDYQKLKSLTCSCFYSTVN